MGLRSFLENQHYLWKFSYKSIIKDRLLHRSDILIITHWSGGQIRFNRTPAGWQGDWPNNSEVKIKSGPILSRFEEIFDEELPVEKNGSFKRQIIDFSKETIGVENWRDIFEGRIDEIINDDTNPVDNAIVGAFGFLAGNSKPTRVDFVEVARKYPDKYEYIQTDRYSREMKNFISLPEYKNRFKYLIDLPGHTYSTKIYWMLFMRRPVFYIPSPLVFEWEKQLKPWEHYIPVKLDLSDLDKNYSWAEDNPEEVNAMMQRMYEFGMSVMHPDKVMNDLVETIKFKTGIG